MKRTPLIVAAVSATVIAALALQPNASAETIENIVVIPASNVVEAEPGSVTPIATVPVPAEFRNVPCVARAQGENGQSVHQGNDLIVSSGETSGVVENYEAQAFTFVDASFPLVLGETVNVSLKMGNSGISSGGLVVSVDCTITTTTTSTTTTTIVPDDSTTTSTTSTTVPNETTTTKPTLPPTE